MNSRNFMEMLKAQWDDEKFVCVGLDSDVEKLPYDFVDSQLPFNINIVNATEDIVCCYKPNIAFYESEGVSGLAVLRATVHHINAANPRVPVILDAKRADIGNTNKGYVKMAFEYLRVDAITVHPYLGREALQPFLDCKDKGIFVLCKTSNPGAGEFQDLVLPNSGLVCWYVAEQVQRAWNDNNNCAVVVGATYPEELQRIRKIVGGMPILIPGVGKQTEDKSQEQVVGEVVAAGMNSQKQGMIINSSRGIIFASQGKDFAEAARRETEKLHNLINLCRKGGAE